MPIKRHGMYSTPTYKTWQQMKSRCTDPSNASYKYYGAKGITYCAEWNDFINFLEDMGERHKGYTLDRLDNSVGYCKINCRWQTPKEQANNRTNNVHVLWEGGIYTPNELSLIWGRPLATTFYRIYKFFEINPESGIYEQVKPLITRNRTKTK